MNLNTNGQPAPPVRIAERLSRGASWIVAGRIVMVLSLTVNTIILARLLEPSDFGLVAIATTIAVIVEMSTKLSLNLALVQSKEVTNAHLDTAFTLNLIRGLLIGAVIMLLSGPIAALYGDERLAPLLIAIGISTSVYGISNPKIALLTRELVFWQDFARTAAERVAIIAVSIPIAYFFRSHWAIVAGIAAGQLSLVVSSFCFRPYRPRLSLAKVRELMSFSVWLTLVQFLQAAANRMDHLLVGYLLGNATLGILTVGQRLAEAPTKETSTPILRTAFPGFAKLRADVALLRPAYQRVQSLVFLLCFPAGLGLAMIAEPAVLLALGEKWEAGILVIQLLASSFALQGIAGALSPLAMAMGRTRSLFMRTLVTVTIRTPIVLVGLFAGGLVGLLIARVVVAFVVVIVSTTLVKRLLGLSYREQFAANWRTIVASLGMVVAVYLTGLLAGEEGTTTALLVELVAQIAVGALAFAALLFALWATTGRPNGPERELVAIARVRIARILPGAHAKA